jgi:hypothetical protein
MAGIRGLVVGLTLATAIISVPARAQLGASVSLTHTVYVTVPPRVKVQVANLAFSAPVPSRVSSSRMNVGGLSLTINATQAWVLAIGSASNSSQKSRLEWSTDESSAYSPVTRTSAAVASGVTAHQAKDATLYFRDSGSQTLVGGGEEPVVLTITAP